MVYRDPRSAATYLLNLIDTPGHVDFSYEVSRSLAACQGVLLLVDATQGIQAQTVANFYLAFDQGLAIVPVLNKLDMPAARPAEVAEELQGAFDIDPAECLGVSAKTGAAMSDMQLQCGCFHHSATVVPFHTSTQGWALKRCCLQSSTAYLPPLRRTQLPP